MENRKASSSSGKSLKKSKPHPDPPPAEQEDDDSQEEETSAAISADDDEYQQTEELQDVRPNVGTKRKRVDRDTPESESTDVNGASNNKTSKVPRTKGSEDAASQRERIRAMQAERKAKAAAAAAAAVASTSSNESEDPAAGDSLAGPPARTGAFSARGVLVGIKTPEHKKKIEENDWMNAWPQSDDPQEIRRVRNKNSYRKIGKKSEYDDSESLAYVPASQAKDKTAMRFVRIQPFRARYVNMSGAGTPSLERKGPPGYRYTVTLGIDRMTPEDKEWGFYDEGKKCLDALRRQVKIILEDMLDDDVSQLALKTELETDALERLLQNPPEGMTVVRNRLYDGDVPVDRKHPKVREIMLRKWLLKARTPFVPTMDDAKKNAINTWMDDDCNTIFCAHNVFYLGKKAIKDNKGKPFEGKLTDAEMEEVDPQLQVDEAVLRGFDYQKLMFTDSRNIRIDASNPSLAEGNNIAMKEVVYQNGLIGLRIGLTPTSYTKTTYGVKATFMKTIQVFDEGEPDESSNVNPTFAYGKSADEIAKNIGKGRRGMSAAEQHATAEMAQASFE